MQNIVQSQHLVGCHFQHYFPSMQSLLLSFPMYRFSSYSAKVYVAKASFTEQICRMEHELRNNFLGFLTKLHSEIIAHKSSASFISSRMYVWLFPLLCVCPFLEYDSQKTYDQSYHQSNSFLWISSWSFLTCVRGTSFSSFLW